MGAPTKPEKKQAIIRSVVSLLQRGLDLKSACVHLKIPYTTVWQWYDQEEAVRIEFDAAMSFMDRIALEVWNEEIFKKKNYLAAKEWLERSNKERFSTKQLVDNRYPDGVTVTTINDLPDDKKLLEELKKKNKKS